MTRRRLALLVLGVFGGVAGVAISSVALASWTATGSGSGRAQALSSQTATVSAVLGSADLYPGFTGGDVFFTVTNPNPFPVTYTSMTAGAVTSSDPTNCPSSNVTASSKSGLNIAAAGGATTATLSIADVVSMSAAAPNGCRGVAFTIALTLAGEQT